MLATQMLANPGNISNKQKLAITYAWHFNEIPLKLHVFYII
jgi:hypothetical protein